MALRTTCSTWRPPVEGNTTRLTNRRINVSRINISKGRQFEFLNDFQYPSWMRENYSEIWGGEGGGQITCTVFNILIYCNNCIFVTIPSPYIYCEGLSFHLQLADYTEFNLPIAENYNVLFKSLERCTYPPSNTMLSSETGAEGSSSCWVWIYLPRQTGDVGT